MTRNTTTKDNTEVEIRFFSTGQAG